MYLIYIFIYIFLYLLYREINMKNIYQLFLFTLILISKTKEISVNELWEITQQKKNNEYKDKSYFFIDMNNKISENEKEKINKSMNNIFLKYGVSSFLFLINKMDEKEKFISNLIQKIINTYSQKEKNSIISLVSIEDNYYYLLLGSEIEWKINKMNIREIKEKSEKEGYEKYFYLIVDKILDELYKHELEEDNIDYPWLDEDEEEDDDEDIIDDKEKDKNKKKENENKINNNNSNYGIYIIIIFLIITIIIVGIWIVHNYRRKLLNHNISSNIDYFNISS